MGAVRPAVSASTLTAGAASEQHDNGGHHEFAFVSAIALAAPGDPLGPQRRGQEPKRRRKSRHTVTSGRGNGPARVLTLAW
ncbi:hypothetical protein [Amycolatopsis sp. NPDC051903]|uniref:hypothetical protein n=1 Tax=Amycolatopsis sp. NPDC051903 TaxID=3363936 RepID=UPI00379DFF0E